MQERPLHRPPSTNGAFSLIELLAVIAIVLVLFTLYWGGQGDSRKDEKLASCRQNLEKIYLAMDIYARDNQDKFPVVAAATNAEEALSLLFPRYTSDATVFICPATTDSPLPIGTSLREGRISYAYYMGRHRTDPDTVLMSDAQVNARSKSKGSTVFQKQGSHREIIMGNMAGIF